MTLTVPHHARREWLTAVGALVLVTVLLVGSAGAQERTGDPAQWRNYWTQLYTVFTHPRCINCHGATDTATGDNHGGGPLGDDDDDFQCIGCHTANTVLVPGRCENGGRILPDDGVLRENVTSEACVRTDEPGEARVRTGETWNGGTTAPPFVGLDMRSLCLAVKKTKGPMGLLEHVREDVLIGFAFEGRRAIADGPFGPVEPEPPPMSREEFSGLLLRWITEAAMACNTDGTVVLTDNVMIDSRSRYGKTAIRNKIDASVFIKSEVPTSELRYDETSTFAFRPVTPGCVATSDGEAHFTAEGKPAARYEIQIGPGLTYRMRFVLGELEGKTDFTYREQLCRPPSGRREELPTEPSTELRFGLDEWQQALPAPPNDPSVLILRGSTSLPNDDFTGVAGVVSGGERKITWDIVIQ